MRTLAVLLSILLAGAAQIGLASHCAIAFSGPESVEAAYRGWVLAQSSGESPPIDPGLNAGEIVGGEATGRGNLAAFIFTHVGGPDSELWRAAMLAVMAIVPLVFAAAACGTSSSTVVRGIAPWFGVAVWWLCGRPLWANGLVELALFGPLAAWFFGSFCGFHRTAGLGSWFGLAAAGSIGWWLLPIPWAMLSIVGAVCWLLVSHRHSAIWHGLVALALLVGFGPAIAPLTEFAGRPDWGLTISVGGSLAISLTDRTVLEPLAAIAITLATTFRPRGATKTADWLAYPAILVLIGHTYLTIGGSASIPAAATNMLGHCLLVPVLAGLGASRGGLVLAIPAIVAGGWLLSQERPALPTAGDESLAAIGNHVSNDARILWEHDATRPWPAVAVPLRFGVPVLDGSCRDAPWELQNGLLGGRPLSDWTDADLLRLFDRWNIAWIRTNSEATADRMLKLPEATRDGELVSLERPHNYLLRGTGRVRFDGVREVILTDIVPERGQVLLSLRYWSDWEASPARIIIEPELGAYDAGPLVRLRVDAPMTRIVLRRRSR